MAGIVLTSSGGTKVALTGGGGVEGLMRREIEQPEEETKNYGRQDLTAGHAPISFLLTA